MDSVDVLVVGAGFAGAVCAERLATAGRRVLVIDQRAHVAGTAYDAYDQAGILIHRYGPHIFHTNSRDVLHYLSRFTAWRSYAHRVCVAVNGQLVPMPINQTTLEVFGGDDCAARAALIEPYTRKQWGEWATSLDQTVFDRIRPRETRDDRYFTDVYQVMPRDGYTTVVERLLDHPHITVRLATRYQDVSTNVSTGHTVYSGPVDEFFGHCYGRLPFRSAMWRFETQERSQAQPVAVVNYPDANVPYTRVSEFKHLTGQIHPHTTVSYEYPMSTGEPYWPVPTLQTRTLYRRYQALAAVTPHVSFVGRLGTYRYLDVHQVVAQALRLAARLVGLEVPCLV